MKTKGTRVTGLLEDAKQFIVLYSIDSADDLAGALIVDRQSYERVTE